MLSTFKNCCVFLLKKFLLTNLETTRRYTVNFLCLWLPATVNLFFPQIIKQTKDYTQGRRLYVTLESSSLKNVKSPL